MSAPSRLLAVVDSPLALDELSSLAIQYPDSIISSGPGGYWVRSRGFICSCITCDEVDRAQYQALTGDWMQSTFIICPDCGNKRCPRATFHENDCSGSNEPGQTGSVYA